MEISVEKVIERKTIHEQIALEILQTIKKYAPIEYQTVEEIEGILERTKTKLYEMNAQL